MVEFWSSATFSGESRVAVSIDRCTCSQRHLGILCYSGQTGQTRRLHLEIPRDLNFEPASEGQPFVAVPNLDAEAHEQLYAWCRRIHRVNKAKIPFGFRVPFLSIDRDTGKYVPGIGGGLTCAGLVLAVFSSAGFTLISEGALWDQGLERLKEDWNWHEKYAHVLSKTSKEHGAALREGFDSIRYRPEEVAAAAHLAPPPVGAFEEIAELSLRINLVLEENDRLQDKVGIIVARPRDGSECRLGDTPPDFATIMRQLDEDLDGLA